MDGTGQIVQILEEVLFFKLRTTEKHTFNSTYLVSVGCGRLAEGNGHETDSCPFLDRVSQSRAVFLPPASHIQLTQDKLN